jgi:hypothetical protein
MMIAQQNPVRPAIGEALQEIQSRWTESERVRRHRVAEWRQQQLLKLISPGRAQEAYDCTCDSAEYRDVSREEARANRPAERRSRRYVLLED